MKQHLFKWQTANIPILFDRNFFYFIFSWKEMYNICAEKPQRCTDPLKGPRSPPKIDFFFPLVTSWPGPSVFRDLSLCTRIPSSRDYCSCQISRKLLPPSSTAIMLSRDIQPEVQLHQNKGPDKQHLRACAHIRLSVNKRISWVSKSLPLKCPAGSAVRPWTYKWWLLIQALLLHAIRLQNFCCYS